MSGVFRTIDPHPLTARRVCTVSPAFGAGGGHTRWVERGRGVKSSEDARQCFVLYVCKYFVGRVNGQYPPYLLDVALHPLFVGKLPPQALIECGNGDQPC
jgi:hypothetical protein